MDEWMNLLYQYAKVKILYCLTLYRIDSFCNANNQLYGRTCPLYLAILRRKNTNLGLITFPFHIATLGLSINVCNLWVHVKVQVCQYTMSMYLADNHCVYLFISIIIHVSLKNLHYPHLSHRFNVFAKY